MSGYILPGNLKRVLLCGTRYGKSYLHAINDSKALELAGIVARGSKASVRLSQQYGVTLFTDVNDIDEEIDVSCIALPQEVGVEIAEKLMQRQIPVLMEHPISLVNLHSLLATATVCGTYCHINSHFAYLQPVSHFISNCKKLNALSTAININVACNSRTLFSMIDIMMRSFGIFSMTMPAVTVLDAQEHYQSCTFLLDTIPLTLTYQNWKHDIDDSKDSPLGHQITVTYPEGVLSLGGTYGPCQWFPLAAGGIDSDIALYNPSTPTFLNHVFYWRNLANQKAMQDLVDTSDNDADTPRYQQKAYLVQLCQIWQSLMNGFGVPKVIEGINSIDSQYWQLQENQTL